MCTARGTRGTGNEIPTSPPPPPWIELPGDVTANILQRLGAEEILLSAEKVCTTWWKVCKDPAMWRVVALTNSSYDVDESDFYDFYYYLMCRWAVDRSHGQLIDLSIDNFGEDKLLSCVADRSSHLRRLTLTDPGNISASALIEAVTKLPRLEELRLIRIQPLDANDVEAIGISCPLLNSFTYDEKWGADDYDGNGIALAVAKTMPNLQHLQLAGDVTTNKGLEAILDGCPHLESLDLSNCDEFIDLTGALRERCFEQIKFLRLPLPIELSDVEYDYDYSSYDYDYNL